MGLSSIFFLSRVKLLEKYFEVSAKQMLVTKSEINAFDGLIEKGYFSKAEIDSLRRGNKIAASADVDDAGTQETDAKIRAAIARIQKQKADFVMSEDSNLRPHLESAGINVISCVDMIYHMAKKGAISKKESGQGLDALRSFGWYKDDVLLKIISEVEKLPGRGTPAKPKDIKVPHIGSSNWRDRSKLNESLKKFKSGSILLGQAAKEAGVSTLELMDYMAANGVKSKYSFTDFKKAQAQLDNFLDYKP